MQHGTKPERIGFASKYHFVHKDASREYEKQPWYFGKMSRDDAENMLASNPDSSFLVRHTSKSGGMDVLTLKYNDEYRNYNIKTDGDSVWISSRKKFKSVSDLISYYMENKAAGVAAKLSSICLIPNPDVDPSFDFNISHEGNPREYHF